MIRELNVRHYAVNSLAFQPPGIDTLQQSLRNTRAILHLKPGAYTRDAVAETVDRTIFTYGKNTRPATLLVGSHNELENFDTPEFNEHIIPVSIQELIACLDIDGLNKDFGLCLSNSELLEATSLLSAVIASHILEDHSAKEQAIFSPPTKQEENPFIWLKWTQQQRSGDPTLVAQIARYNSAIEGILFHGNTFGAYKNPVSLGVREAISQKKWLPSSQLLILNEAIAKLPLASRNRETELLIALATAEMARERGLSLHRVTVADNVENYPFIFDDHETYRLAILLEYLQTQLYMHGIPFSQATADHYKALHDLLIPETGLRLIPPLEKMEKYLIPSAIRNLTRKLEKRWAGVEIPYPRPEISSPYIESRLIPDWDPKKFGETLQKCAQFIQEVKGLGQKAIDELRAQIWRLSHGESIRPFYAVVTQEYLPPYLRELFSGMGIYNYSNPNEDFEHPQSFNLNTDEMREVREQILDYLKQANVIGATMFVDETDGVKRFANMAQKRLGFDRVVMADHERSTETGEAARATGARIASFKENMRKIKWDKLVADGIIPAEALENGIPRGLKGINFMNLIVELDKMEKEGKINDETWILLTDADITNQGEQNDLPKEKWYDPFLYLGLVLLDNHRRNLGLRAIHGAKTMAGRNNYNTHFMFDDMANSSDENMTLLGLNLATYIWPHTETRGYTWKKIKRMLGAKDMQVEQTQDMCTANMDIKEGIRRTAQVILRVDKHEDRPSPSKREWGMMNNLARGLKEIKTGGKGVGRLPMEMTLEDIGQVNARFSMRGRVLTISVDETHAPRQPQIAIADVLLPSWDMLKEGGYLND